MDFYEVLEKRRTIRDFSDREVSDELLKKILSAAFKAPTNDHLRQFEFIVVRGQENIARLISPVAGNTEAIQQTSLKAAASVMDKDEHAMFADALPKQQRMLMRSNCLVLPFLPKGLPVVSACRTMFAQLFCLCMGSGREHPAGGNGGGVGLCVPHTHRQ